MKKLLRKLFVTKPTRSLSRCGSVPSETIEILEDKRLLTDVVSVTIKGNSISLVGDNAWNYLVIGRNGDNVWIQGVQGTTLGKDALDPSKGTILGPDSFVTNINVADVSSLKVNLKGGNDRIGIDPIQVSGTTNIVTGKGVDWVLLWGNSPSPLGGGSFRGKTNIKTGSGNDVVAADNWTFDGPVKVATGSGSDLIELAELGPVTFNDKVSASLGSGNDLVFVDNSQVFGTSPSVAINGGSGSDIFQTPDGLLAGDLAAAGINTKAFERFEFG